MENENKVVKIKVKCRCHPDIQEYVLKVREFAETYGFQVPALIPTIPFKFALGGDIIPPVHLFMGVEIYSNRDQYECRKRIY